MRTRYLIHSAVAVVVMLGSVRMMAQERSFRHHRYKLVDVGTFGGPHSVYNVFTRIWRNDGTIVGAANTATPDPYAPDCFDSPDNCFVLHASKWQRGRLTDIGVLPNGYSSYTNAINSHGRIVGQSQNGEIDPLSGTPSFVATLWDHGDIRDLGTLGGSFSFAIAVNDKNFVMGASENATIDSSGFAQVIDIGSRAEEWHAFGWNGREMFDLGNLGGPGAFPNDMNNAGQVVGFSPTSSIAGPFGFAPFAPFLWDKGRMRNLGTLGGTLAVASAINNRGEVVGTSNLAGDETEHPFLWQNGKMKDLGTLGGSYGIGEWISEAGEAIGFSGTVADQELHAFVWKHGTMTDLGTVDGDNSSNAFGINTGGQIVGQSWFWDGQQVTASHAFLWENGGPMVDLNALVPPDSKLNLVEADFVTDRGEIVAYGITENGDLHTAILIPQTDGEFLDSKPPAAPETLASPGNSLPAKLSAALQARVRRYHQRSDAKRGRSIPIH